MNRFLLRSGPAYARRAHLKTGAFLGTTGRTLRFDTERDAESFIRTTPGVWGVFLRAIDGEALVNVSWWCGEVQV